METMPMPNIPKPADHAPERESVIRTPFLKELLKGVKIGGRVDAEALMGILNANQTSGMFTDKRIDEYDDEALKKAFVGMNDMVVRREIASPLLEEIPDLDQEDKDLSELFTLLDRLVESAFDVSAVINQGTLIIDHLTSDEKMVLNGATKTIAELIVMTEYDTEDGLSFKSIFAQLILQAFQVHKLRNDRLNDSSDRGSAERYIRSEREMVSSIERYFDNWMRGAVDMELASKLALSEVDGIDGVSLSTPKDDVVDGNDLWISLDRTGSAGTVPSHVAESRAFREFFDANWMGIQVKSHWRKENDVPGGIGFDVRKDIRHGGPQIFVERGEKKPYYKMIIDVSVNADMHRKRLVPMGDGQMEISQFDFSRFLESGISDRGLDNIPEILFNRFTEYFNNEGYHGPANKASYHGNR